MIVINNYDYQVHHEPGTLYIKNKCTRETHMFIKKPNPSKYQYGLLRTFGSKMDLSYQIETTFPRLNRNDIQKILTTIRC